MYNQLSLCESACDVMVILVAKNILTTEEETIYRLYCEVEIIVLLKVQRSSRILIFVKSYTP